MDVLICPEYRVELANDESDQDRDGEDRDGRWGDKGEKLTSPALDRIRDDTIAGKVF
jgi:hypothetical protein